ncbi:unnamed protein product [Cylicocyclus nassatus]|uniref:COP9 signalosome complex subunit 6 n=1 Tax=Cylicocyclus nassatus TaxID=53992 RepID=A0AA36DRP8_CYLNA|nr:unnamed protein product [Cylicocyclus nassatus]
MLGRFCAPSCSFATARVVISRKLSVPAEKTLEAVATNVERDVPKTDISALKPRHRVIAAGGMPPLEFEWERQRSAQMERFGMYGLKSGVDPGICWPTVEEIEEEKAIGLYREYDTCLREMKALKQKQKEKEAARLAELEKNLKKYPEALAKFEASQVKAEKERDAKEIALENRIREIQEYFGYWMDPKDPRFEVMLQQKEQEEKKAAKMARRAELQKKKIAKCSLHPLVIINISEHWTRVRAQSRDKAAQKVFGAVLGKVDEGHVEMVNSFELRMFSLDGHTRYNEEFLRQRLAQYNEVFPELDLVGWYCTGEDGIEPDELLLQSLFALAIDSPLMVKLNPIVSAQTKSSRIPVKVYYSRETPLVSTGHELTELDWTLVSEQSERIGIDHIARLSQAGDDGAVSIEGKQMRAAGSAVSMLLDKIGVICEYLKGVQEGKYPPNDEIIREANKICQRLPLLKPAEFDDGFKTQERDARAAMLLAKMTEVCGTLSSLQAKTNILSTITAWRSIATIPQQQPKKKSSQRVTAATTPNAPVSAESAANNTSSHSPDVD